METNVNYTLVGAFVILLLTAVILGIIWLSSGFSIQNYTTYLVYMQESVSGLSPESQVEYNGVSVGAVKSIELNRKNPHLVDVFLNIKSDTPITRGTVATLASRGLTGMVYIALKDRSLDLRPLVRQPDQRYPVIPTAPSIFVRLDTALTQLSDSFHELSTSVHSLLDEENLHSIKQSLINFQLFTKNLADNNAQISAIMRSTSKAVQVFERQTLPETSQVLLNINALTRDLSDVSAEIKQNPSVLIRGKQPQPLGPGE